MKSLLVDALRQKDGKQESESLSDSGSFATPNADAAATAGQDVPVSDVIAEDEELELMATGRLIVANDADDELDQGNEPVDVEFSDTLTTTDHLKLGETVIPTHDSLPSMPPVARYAPLVCGGLAVVSAVAWFAVQQFELIQQRSALGGSAEVLQADRATSQTTAETKQARFRYLGVDGQPLEDETSQ